MKKLLFILLFFVTTTLYPQNPQTELVKYAESYLFVREIGYNRSPEIDSMNIAVHVPLGSSWCASFNSWIFNHFNIINPNSAWSPNWSLKQDRIWKAKQVNTVKLKPGDVVTFYYSNLGRVGHTGIITQVYEDYVITIEGNTNDVGSREGSGVYKKKRSLDKIYTVTRYTKIKPQK
jgi:hypothetical protein